MGRSATVAGTGFEDREFIIKRHCKDGLPVTLRREPHNKHYKNAIAVYLSIPRLGGLFGRSLKKIGYVKAHSAKSLAKRMDSGQHINGRVKSFDAPEDREFPRVSLELDY